MEGINYKEKLSRVFKFLKQYNDIKNPIQTNIREQLWNIQLQDLPDNESIFLYNPSEEDTDRVLIVRRPELEECPRPPETIREWLKSGWDSINLEVEVIESKLNRNPKWNPNDEDSSKYIDINFKDDEDRVCAYQQWVIKRRCWLAKEIPSRKSMDIFNEVYGLYARIQKEAEAVELMLGDGILSWGNILSVPIEHPILLQTLKIEFNADVPEFIISCTEKLPELYSSLFYNIPDININLLKENILDLEKNSYSPLGGEETSLFLNRIAVMLSSEGKFMSNKGAIKSAVPYPQIFRNPVIFLRKRTLGYSVALDSILEDIQETAEIPNFLKDLVGYIEEPRLNSEKQSFSNLNPNGIDENILLTKPANSEQLTVAKQLEKYGAVLVQGPPGTGKTHTIANLIGHLLSEGKSILVTSHSEKALSVLKEKVSEALQPLCLSLLSTTESRMEMERTLDTINENRSRLDVFSLEREIETLQKQRKRFLALIDDLRMELRNARSSEYRPIIIAGREFSPVDAGKFINRHKEDSSWIPSPVLMGSPLPIKEAEIVELYKTNGELSITDEAECNLRLPQTEELLHPVNFNSLLEQKKKYDINEINYGKELWNGSSETYKESELMGLINEIRAAVACIDENHPWTLAVIEAGRKEASIRRQWEGLVEEINHVYDLSNNTLEFMIEYDPRFSIQNRNEEFEKALKSMAERLEEDKKISRYNLILNPLWKKIMNSCTVNGHAPHKSNELRALIKYDELLKERSKLESRWNRQMAVLGAPQAKDLGENFEVICKKYCGPILTNLNWYKSLWYPVKEKLKGLGFDWNAFDRRLDLSSERFSEILNIKSELGNSLVKMIEAQILRISFNTLQDDIKKLDLLIRKYSDNRNYNVLFDLLNAVSKEDEDLYSKSYERLLNLNKLQKVYHKRQTLLEKLRISAPAWAEAIENRELLHGFDHIPGNVADAWHFRQFSDEMDNRNKVSMEKIQDEILRLEDALRQNTTNLAYKRAWKSKLENIENNKKQVQAIEGWRQLIRKIGSGKGKRAAGLIAEARKLMPLCQTAVPVWIMPLNKVVENFEIKQNKFDVVIIDEASQADVMALIALYLGKKVIIVGDNEQVSPLSVGQKLEELERLIREFLFDIPSGVLYTGQFSIYDLAQSAGYQPVRLKEHFRCVPEIIQYSNLLSYNGEIKPLRESSEVETRPFTVSFRVDKAVCKNKINMKEAEAITALIAACCEQPEYKDKSFGVITLRGDKQATVIGNLLRDRLGISECEKRRILCGNSANFQGDERDIIFLSMVDTNEGEGPLRLYGYGTDNVYKKRYNVAASRARDQMWLVHSIDSQNDLKPGDIRKGLIEYFKDPNVKAFEYNKNVQSTESEFERLVLKKLIEKGYKVIPQFIVGAYRIDMVVEGNGKRIAVECDGERWHNSSNLEDDLRRQSILERLGWRFIRIRGSEFFRNPDAAMKEVFNRLEEYEVTATLGVNKLFVDEKAAELKERIIRRAGELMVKDNLKD